MTITGMNSRATQLKLVSTYVILRISLPLWQPVNCIFWPMRMTEHHIALLSEPTVYSLYCVTIQEGDYEMFGASSFQVFFHEICNLNHIKSLNDSHFNKRLFLCTAHQWKNAICYLVWKHNMKTKLLLCLKSLNAEQWRLTQRKS